VISGPILLVLRLLLAGVLYAFLAWGIWVLWRDLSHWSVSLARLRAPSLILSLQVGNGERSYRFTSAEVVIGRDPACDLRLEDKTISAQHARLSYHHSQWWVQDLSSRNGTFLNGDLASEALVITAGDKLRCGQLNFQIDLEEDGAPG
jgi:hypothetical protein